MLSAEKKTTIRHDLRLLTWKGKCETMLHGRFILVSQDFKEAYVKISIRIYKSVKSMYTGYALP